MKRNATGYGLMLALLATSCYYDNEATLYPDSGCTAKTGVSFSSDVMVILNTHCNSCHAGAGASGGVRLDSYDKVMITVANGSLSGSINHSPGYVAMPDGGGKLPACTIKTIQTWIDEGALNN